MSGNRVVAVVETVPDLRAAVDQARRNGDRIGMVPTMGYLHAGHASLIERAAAECGFVVVSLFVNPLQFGPTEDLDRYPRDLPADLETVGAAGGHVLFHPSVDEMYPEGPPLTRVTVAEVTAPLCGAARPGHFEGVTTVVTKLFAACEPDRAYFGRKDGQQLAVIRRMTADLNLRPEIVGCPTMRESDGLAMSSRNAYLMPEDRAVAPVLYRSLRSAAEIVLAGERDPRVVESHLLAKLRDEPRLDVEYAEVRDARTMAALQHISGEVILAVAARCGPARLIDNMVIDLTGAQPTVDAGVSTKGEIKGDP